MNKFYKSSMAVLLCSLLSLAELYAQTTISGKVSDTASSETLAGVSIVVKGQVIGTISDTDGQFSLKVSTPPPFTLLFSFVGYRTTEVEITNQNTTGLDVKLEATGDLKHHLIEDVAITLGAAFAEVIPEACARYGDRTVAMDDAVVQVIVDAGGRPFYRGPLPSTLYDHWMRSFADNARMTLHIIVIRGNDRHHIVEAAFKALGFAIRDALRDTDATFSTKGAVTVRKS